jgi:DNA modification methylase
MRNEEKASKLHVDFKKVDRSKTGEYLKNLRIELLPVSELKPYPRNARIRSPQQIRQIADSIRTFKFTNPILIDANGVVIAGHGRIEAAKLLGLESLPTIRLADMTEAQKRAYALADNKLAEVAGWDPELLALELSYISELDIDFDLTITGFETAEIDLLLETGRNDDRADEVVEPPAHGQAVTRPGDLWELGKHRLLCGDATKAESFKLLLKRGDAQLVFSDPPYNLAIRTVSGLGAIQHREFAMASGEMSKDQYIAFLKTVLGHLSSFSADGSIHFLCIDWRHCYELLSAAFTVYSELKNLCVWAKENGGMGSLYRSGHELVFVFKNGGAPHINNIELGKYGRNRTNVWNYPGMNSFGEKRLEELKMHPTVKPVALVADAIRDCSKRRGLVLDCFGGSGTTLLACEKTGRFGRVMELDPAYVDVAIRRFQKLTKKDAVHALTARTFREMERERVGQKQTTMPDGTTGRGKSDVK